MGEENLNGDIVKWALQNNKRIAVNKLNAQKAQELGFKHPDDVRRTIGADEIRHTLSRHGENSELVKKSGQPPVNENDIANYQKISDNADETLKSLDNSGNLVEVSFKQVNGYFVVVEQVRNKNNEFSFKTMFKGNGTYKNSEAYTKTAEKAQTLSQGYKPSANSFAQSADEIIPNSNSQSQVPQKSLLEQIKEKEAELMRLKEMAKNADENTQKQGLNADESLTKKENERFEEVLEKPAQKKTQNEPTQDIDKVLKAQDEPKETPSIEKESLQLDEMPSQKVNKLFDEILTPNYYQNEKAVFYENMIKNADKNVKNAEKDLNTHKTLNADENQVLSAYDRKYLNEIFSSTKQRNAESDYLDKRIYREIAHSEGAAHRDFADAQDLEQAKRFFNIQRKEIEKLLNIKPLAEFGTNYAEFYRDGQGAVKKLLAEKQGQVAGAFYRDDLAKAIGTGEIDLVWGNDEIGLKKIIDKHLSDFADFKGDTGTRQTCKRFGRDCKRRKSAFCKQHTDNLSQKGR